MRRNGRAGWRRGILGAVLLIWLACTTFPHLGRVQMLPASDTRRPPHHHSALHRPARRHATPRRAMRRRHRRPASFFIPSARSVHLGRARKATALRPTRRQPWVVRIPSIGVQAKLIVLGNPRSGALPVPALSAASKVGWYSFSAVPGKPGNVVLVGHVDTYLGPAVFYNLYLLRPGNKIYIRLGSHGSARYTVRSVRELPKSRFPVKQIFSRTRARKLWLITCGGPFDYATRHYLDNIVVSASQ